MKALTVLAFLAALFTAHADDAPAPHETRVMEGWTIHVRATLLTEQKDATEKTLVLLQAQLREIVKAVPAPAVAELRKIPLWISPEYAGVQPRAEYHPDKRWLAANGRDPAMAKGVEFTNARAYAMTNDREYFAETTEAFFGRNDFFPFTREELEKHDPQMAALLQRLWNPAR